MAFPNVNVNGLELLLFKPFRHDIPLVAHTTGFIGGYSPSA
jgi:hypothetical protein